MAHDDRQRAEEQMEAFLRGSSAEGVEVRRVFLSDGAVPEAIVDYVEANAIDLIMLSPHGWRGMSRLLLGGVAREVVRRAPCPVLTVPRVPMPLLEPLISRILVPVDPPEEAGQALSYAREIAEIYHAGIDLLHVHQEPVLQEGHGMEGTGSAVAEETRVREVLQVLAREALGDAPVAVHVRRGYPSHGILSFARERGVGLIVMSRRGRESMRFRLPGSTAERVIRRAPCPVLLVQPTVSSGAPEPERRGSATERAMAEWPIAEGTVDPFLSPGSRPEPFTDLSAPA